MARDRSGGSSGLTSGLVLVDKSAHVQALYDDRAAMRIDALGQAGKVATCAVVAGELMYSARNPPSMTAIKASLDEMVFLHLTPEAEDRAQEVMILMMNARLHRAANVADILTAATAEVHGAAVLHYDQDFDHIAKVTGQPTEWIIPRGEGHGASRN